MKNTKKINLILFALCFGVFFILFGNTSKVNAHLALQVKNTTVLNVRAAENSDANTEILGVLYKGDTINVDYINKQTGWAKLSYTNFIRESANSKKYIKLSRTGYCSLSYLGIPSNNTLYKTQKKVSLYEDYSTSSQNSSRKIATIKTGKNVKVVWTNNHWAKLSFGGYCLKKDLKKHSGVIRYVYNTPTLNVRSSAYVLDTNKKGELTSNTKVYVVETVTTKDNNGSEYKWAKLKNGSYCCMDYLTSSQLEAVVYSETLADTEAAKHYNNTNTNSNSNSTTTTTTTQLKTESNPHFTTSTTKVYEKPSTDSKVHAVLGEFTVIDVVDWSNGWYEILGGYYIQGKDVSLYISKIDAYLANLSPTKGKIVLTCDNGKKLTYHCQGGNQGYPTPLSTSIGQMSHIFMKGYVEVEDSLANKILKFAHNDCSVFITKDTL